MSEREIVLEVQGKRLGLLRGQIYLIGKKTEGSLKHFIGLPSESNADSKHATVEVHSCTPGDFDSKVSVVDLYSNAGTFLNGKRLNSMLAVRVPTGSTLRFGNVESTIKLSAPAESPNSSGFLDGVRNSSNISCSPDASHQQSHNEFANNANWLLPEVPLRLIPASQQERNKQCITDALDLNDGSDVNKTENSFSVPNTQFCEKRDSTLGENVSIDESVAGVSNDSSNDSFIPETQQIIVAGSSSQRRILLPANTFLNSTAKRSETTDTSAVECSQFHICTDDFNAFESDSSDLLGDVHSMIIPRIECEPVRLNDVGEMEINSPAATIAAECAAKNCAEQGDDRELDTCTPDLFDLPELALDNVYAEKNSQTDEKDDPLNRAKNIAVSDVGISKKERTLKGTMEEPAKYECMAPPQISNSKLVITSDSKSTVAVVNTDDEEDFLLTQIFTIADTGGRDERREDKEDSSVPLPLSNKENMLPLAAELDASKDKTQIFTSHSVVPRSSSAKSTTSHETTTDTEEDDDGLPATQIFPLQRKRKSSILPSVATKICLSSTLLHNDETNYKPNATSLLEVTEKPVIPSMDTFKKPEGTTTMRVGSTVSNASTITTLASQSESMEMLMCTPKFIKDLFEDYGASSKESLVSAKKKALFGEDSEEEEDMLKLINAPKVSHDFDKLLPHLRMQRTKAKLPIQPMDETPASAHKNSSIFSKDTSKKEKPSQNRSHDEQLVSREKECLRAEVEMQKKSNQMTAEQSTRSMQEPHNQKSYRNAEENMDLKEKITKVDGQTKCSQSRSDTEKPMPTRRMTRLLSRYEESTHDPTGRKNQSTTIATTSTNSTSTKKPSSKPNAKSIPNVEEKRKYAMRSRSSSSEKEKSVPHNHVTSLRSRHEGSSTSKRRMTRYQESTHEPTGRKNQSTTIATTSTNSTSTKKPSSKPNAKSIPNVEEKRKYAMRSRSSSSEKEKNVPHNHLTSLRSRHEESSTSKSVKFAAIAGKTKPSKAKNTKDKQKQMSSRVSSEDVHVTADTDYKRQTRSRSTTESQESNYSSAASTKSRVGSKRKTQISEDDKSKRLRIASSQEDYSSPSPSSNSSGKAAPKLKVTMTMVEPKLFERLAQNSPGIWTVAKDPVESDVLIMDKGNRTYKFLIAMAKGIPILTSKWLQSVNKTGKVVHSSEFFFMDPAFEKRHKFSLLKSLEAARTKSLFDGYEFLMTTNILPTPNDMKAIVSCAGGTVRVMPSAEQPNQKIYLISSSHDKEQWHKYRRENSQICIINAEGIMAAVMRHNVKELDANMLA